VLKFKSGKIKRVDKKLKLKLIQDIFNMEKDKSKKKKNEKYTKVRTLG